MEQLLEQQWEQGAQFLMQQGDHFDSEFLLHSLTDIDLVVLIIFLRALSTMHGDLLIYFGQEQEIKIYADFSNLLS